MSTPEKHRCYLLELPPELRLVIYDYFFLVKTINIWIDWNVYRWRSYKPNGSVSLLATCKTIFREATPVFYDRTTVHFSICDEFGRPLSRYHRFCSLKNLNANAFSLVSKVRFSLHTLTEPIFPDLLEHVLIWLGRLSFCVDVRAIEIHFEFWSTISDDNLLWVYSVLSHIEYEGELEIGTRATGPWTTLYEARTFKSCHDLLRHDILAKRYGKPLLMRNEHVGSVVGPRDIIIKSKTDGFCQSRRYSSQQY